MSKRKSARKKGRPGAAAPDWRPRFIDALAQTGNITRACLAAGIDRALFYRTIKKGGEFARSAKQAMQIATDLLEEEARRRAYEGLARKKFNGKGEAVIDPATGNQYVEREYSDTLLIFLLKAHRPAKFRERYEHTHSGPKGGPIPVEFSAAKLKGMTDDELARLHRDTLGLPLARANGTPSPRRNGEVPS